jgi:pyruvate dehydrogenase E1 component alpha subunit/2-oxoisovalerate dehydrogenase E1 component alpha subunit
MLMGRLLDMHLLALQRQGLVGPSYSPYSGHEATNVGAAMALQKDDWVFPSLREQLVALVRGMELTSYANSLFTNSKDHSMGRQVPWLISAREVNYVSMASDIGAQIIQAGGCAYAQRYRKAPGVTVAFFGDGATSTGDFHSGMNFAGVYHLPILFLCVNNQWAISLPVEKQTAMPMMAEKAKAYGFRGVKVDGTDVIQVYTAVKKSREAVAAGVGPVFLELVVYRMTHQSSSDEPVRSSTYAWDEEARVHDPLARLDGLLERTGILAAGSRETIRKELEEKIRRAVAEAQVTPPPGPETLFTDTVKEAYWPLTEERETFDRDQGGHFP